MKKSQSKLEKTARIMALNRVNANRARIGMKPLARLKALWWSIAGPEWMQAASTSKKAVVEVKALREQIGKWDLRVTRLIGNGNGDGAEELSRCVQEIEAIISNALETRTRKNRKGRQ